MFDFAKRWFKQSAVSRVIPMNLGRPIFPGRDYNNFSKEGYKLNVIAYRCISLISTAAASVPWLLYNDDEEITDHNLLRVLRKPNPTQTGRELFTELYAHDLLVGDGYLERVVLGAGEIKELYSLRPDRMAIVPGRFGPPLRYEYKIGQGQVHSFEVDPITGKSDVLHVRRFNPMDDYYGQSPIEAAGMSVDSHNEATKWNYALLKNSARPGGALEYEGQLNDEDFDRLKNEVEQNYSGSRRGRPMLLQGGLKWVEMMLSQVEMDWVKGKENSAREIAIAYSVPEQLVGVPGQQTFNNYREARLALYEDAVLPLLDRYSEALTNWVQQLTGNENLRVAYDEDRIPALSIRREQQWDRVNGADFLTIDEKRTALGYGEYEPEEGKPASVIFVGAADIPLSMAVSMSDSTSIDAEDEEQTQDANVGSTPVVDEAVAAQGADVQSLAMNGAQIAAALQLIQSVVDEALPPESAVALIRVAFPTISEETANAMIKPAADFVSKKPKPQNPNLNPEGEDEDEDDPKKPDERDLADNVVKALVLQQKRDEKALMMKAHSIAYGKKRKRG